MGIYYDFVPASEMRSDRAKGTPVYDWAGQRIGRVTWLLIDKASGRVSAARVAIGGFMGFGARHHVLPWEQIAYDSELDGYKANIRVEQERSVRSGHVPVPSPGRAHADA
jgi:sporulation protein YlmC with PRC-barrel domain